MSLRSELLQLCSDANTKWPPVEDGVSSSCEKSAALSCSFASASRLDSSYFCQFETISRFVNFLLVLVPASGALSGLCEFRDDFFDVFPAALRL